MALRQLPSRAPAGVSRPPAASPATTNSHLGPLARTFRQPIGCHVQHQVRASVVAEPAPEELEFLEEPEDLNVDDMYKQFEGLLNETRACAEPGDIVSGLVFSVDQKGAYVDFGAKEVGFVPVAEASVATIKNVSGLWLCCGDDGW